jgi:murein DD-endopeptidase MepM/ murein hydrolase activator NlpD
MQLPRFTIRSYYFIALIVMITAVAVYYPLRVSAGVRGPQLANLSDVSFIEPNAIVIESHNEIVKTSELELARGQSLSDLLQNAGFTGYDAFDATDSLAGIIDMRRIQTGQDVIIGYYGNGRPMEVRVPVRFDKTVIAKRHADGWQAETTHIDIFPVPTVVTTTVESSLFQAAKDSGIPLSIMMEAIGLFSFEVDFQRDIQGGNKVVLFYEKLFDESGNFLAAGELLYARLDLEDRFAEAWRYERLDGTVEYYEVSGDSVRKSLLKTPVDGARISSGFGYRNIPILDFSGLHRGMDFAVATGTPVMASGEGTVTIAGWHDQYGYRVKIRHPNHYDTMYAHFSSIASGIKTGVRVEQGQIVGYVGSTGNSTGPHCHYEVHYYGSPVNPAELKFPPGHKLETEDMRLFDLEREALIAEFTL